MGMYSTYESDNIKVLDSKALKRIRAQHQAIGDNYAVNLISEDGKTIQFYEWSGYKIYGYFYADTVLLLNEIAPYISGEVVFIYEEGFKFKLLFKDKKVYLLTEKEVIYSEAEELSKDEAEKEKAREQSGGLN